MINILLFLKFSKINDKKFIFYLKEINFETKKSFGNFDSFKNFPTFDNLKLNWTIIKEIQFEPMIIEFTKKINKSTLNTKSYIYLIEDSKYYKIGKSDNPEKRLKTIKTGNIDAKLLFALELEKHKVNKLELELHQKFYKHHVNLEWFNKSNEILEYFKNF